jgi:hypothetical protein
MDNMYTLLSNNTTRFLIFLFLFFAITTVLFGDNEDYYEREIY